MLPQFLILCISSLFRQRLLASGKAAKASICCSLDKVLGFQISQTPEPFLIEVGFNGCAALVSKIHCFSELHIVACIVLQS